MKKLLLLSCVGILLLTGAGIIDLGTLENYSSLPRPAYIVKDNTGANPITDMGATLGRVLFYDRNLSVNKTISCGSCHKQAFAFGDTAVQSKGLNGGLTGRHAMRLVNARFAAETKFFWDERAASLEDQTTRPIQDHVEMGFSGANGDPGMDSLIRRLEGIEYYPELFTRAFGDAVITESRIQQALAQFVRSIQSFDSRYDAGRAQVPNDEASFPNFTADENAGKQLFLNPPNQGGAGCQGCHRAPEFDIDPTTRNNGVTGVAGNPGQTDLTNTRAPSLRDLFNPNGTLNGPLMHTGAFPTLESVIEHYNLVPQDPANTNRDARVSGPGGDLQLTAQEKSQLVAFLRTLSGNEIYTHTRWSDPFDANGNLQLTYPVAREESLDAAAFTLYPNPATDLIQVRLPEGRCQVTLYQINGVPLKTCTAENNLTIDLLELPAGVYWVEVYQAEKQFLRTRTFVKQ